MGRQWASLLVGFLALCGGVLAAAHARPTAHVRPSPRRLDVDHRIYNGKNSTEIYPWMVTIWEFVGTGIRLLCGGSLVSPSWVLTAAHCVDKLPPSFVIVAFGDIEAAIEDFQASGVDLIIAHPSYKVVNDATHGMDVALLRLETVYNAEPISLNSGNALERTGTSITMSGWGATYMPVQEESESGPISYPESLQEVSMTVREGRECSQTLGWPVNATYHLCTNGTDKEADPCLADAGNPLFAAKSGGHCQVGVSFSGKSTSCSSTYKKKRYSVHVKVSRLLSWIKTYEPQISTCS